MKGYEWREEQENGCGWENELKESCEKINSISRSGSLQRERDDE